MKKLRVKRHSKKGFTLVELIVTIAILGMVAGMGVGIVGQALQNYSKAQITSREQETAVSIENFIRNAVRVSGSVEKSDSLSDPPPKDRTAFYLKFTTEGALQTIRCETTDIANKPVVTYLSYNGVESVTVQVKKQKPTKTDSFSNQCFIYMDYAIKMVEGYELKGSIVLNNADKDRSMEDKGTYTDTEEEITVDKAHPGAAIGIIKGGKGT